MTIEIRKALGLVVCAGLATCTTAQPFVAGPDGEEEARSEFFRAPPAEANNAIAMPMPNDAGMPIIETDPNTVRPVSFDMQSGLVSVGDPVWINAIIDSNTEEGAPGLLPEGDEGFGSRNMGALGIINNPEANPWNNNCKLLMRFGGSYFVCSGTLIDRRTVLTAGHCINEGSGGAFADEVWVFPGYENDDGNNGGLPFTDEQDWPFGFGKAVSQVTWNAWAVNGDFNYDQAYLRLDRPIGFLTGNFGYGYSSSCSTFTTTYSWNNASYPAEAAYGWNGNFMYYRFGTFDSCPSSNRSQYNSAGYGGMSGSSEYRIDGSSRYAYGVASTSDRATYTRHNNMWQNSFEYIRDTFIEAAKPAAHDLWAMFTRTTNGATSVTAGNTMTVNGIAGNWSQAAYNGSSNYTYRLSTNDLISTGDISMASGSFSYNYGTTGSVYTPARTVTIPKNTPTGTRWIGLLLDHADASSANNDASYQDAWEISVSGVADPAITAYQAQTGSFLLGSNTQIQYIIQNLGGDASNSITVSVRASTNDILSTGDPEIASFVHSGLSGNASFDSGVVNVALPESLGEGTRYIGIIISASDDTDTGTASNYALQPTPITLIGRPDVNVTNFVADTGSYYHGQTVQVTAIDLTNDGLGATGTMPIELRISTNNVISTGDTLVASSTVASLAPGGSSPSYTWSYTVPGSLSTGNYYAGVRIPTLTNETVTNNNTRANASTFTIIDCLADVNNDGLISSADFSAWIAAYNAAALGCDQNGDGACTPADFSAWIANFNAGCPGL